MATDEHKRLAAFIKETHNRLREECQLYGPKEAWNRHIARTEELQNYAVSMKELATSHWTQNRDPLKKHISTHCRIEWIKRQCFKYYFEGGKILYDDRELAISAKIENPGCLRASPSPIHSGPAKMSSEPKFAIGSSKFEDLPPKLKLLDVGSCYNPLGDDENFDVTAIDLAPYSTQVLKCDFLNVPVGPTQLQNSREISQLEMDNYDICVFSLLLEYLPSPDQRFNCCKKARDILRPGGLLIIITPDSKHVGANANIMKSWRFVLAHLGFMRVTYEKLKHLHCISFRKCFQEDVAKRWADMQVVDEDDLFKSLDKVFIPQDFHEIKTKEDVRKECWGEGEKSQGFGELPGFIG